MGLNNSQSSLYSSEIYTTACAAAGKPLAYAEAGWYYSMSVTSVNLSWKDTLFIVSDSKYVMVYVGFRDRSLWNCTVYCYVRVFFAHVCMVLPVISRLDFM